MSSFLNLKILLRSFFQSMKNATAGVNITVSVLRNGVANIAYFSGISLASVFGVTSPKMSRSTVIIIVETVGPLLSFMSLMKSTVATDDAVMLTILFPTSTVESSLS